MAYERTIWKPRVGTNKNRFEKSQETTRYVILQNAPSAITEPGTPFSVDNMNKIEQGIFDAHEAVSAKADDTIAELSAGSGTDMDTPAQKNPSIWGMIQIFWDRLFALNNQKANLSSPVFTGTPRAPTPLSTVNDTQIATMEVLHMIAEDEADARQHAITQAVDNEANARQTAIAQAVSAEAQMRQQKDEILYNNQNQTNENLQVLQDDFNAWIGRGGYLNAFDFGTASPNQNDLTNYALSQISSISDPLGIWNGTKIPNLYNGHTWILTNTQDTDPPVFEWSDQGPPGIGPFGPDMGGYVTGANSNDGFGFLTAKPGAKAKITGLETIEQIQKLLIAPGKISHYNFRNETDAAQWRLMRADGRTISVNDPRAERLLQYCLIPYEEALADPNIMGFYLTDDYFATKADLKASGKKRPTPAENGAYYAIPCVDGLFIRNAEENATLGPTEGTLYDGNVPGSYDKGKNWKHTHLQNKHDHTQEGHYHSDGYGSNDGNPATTNQLHPRYGHDNVGGTARRLTTDGTGGTSTWALRTSTATPKINPETSVNQDAGTDGYNAPPSISGVAYLSY